MITALLNAINAQQGYLAGHQIRMVCPNCNRRSLDLTIGDTNRLIVSCLRQSCKGKSKLLLDKLGLPAGPLTDDMLALVNDEVFHGSLTLKASTPAAPVEVLHKVYSEWLAACPPDQIARDFLKLRGFTDAAITKYQYGRWPVKGCHHRIHLKLDVPGIYEYRGERRLVMDGPKYAGILIPVRDVLGNICQLKLRLYNPDEVGKMRTFSSSRYGGPGVTHRVHVPLGTPLAVKSPWITEGELKADVTWMRGQPCISVPGVNSL